MTNSVRNSIVFSAATVASAFFAVFASAADESLFTRLDADSDGFVTKDEVPPAHRRMLARLLRTSDMDGDGRLSADEFVESVSPSRPEKSVAEVTAEQVPGADAFIVLMANLDPNHDGRITPSEVPKKWENAYTLFAETADANKDGVISRFELRRGGPAISREARRISQALQIDIQGEKAKIPPATWKAMESPRARSTPAPSPERVLNDPAAAAEAFEMLDKNGDGLAEMKEVPDGRRIPFSRLLRREDQDNDGKLNKEEFVKGTLAWAKQERNAAKKPKQEGGDGELAARQHVERFLRLDRDGDGKISKPESRGRLQKLFDRVDRDKDGALDQAELTAFAQRLGGESN